MPGSVENAATSSEKGFAPERNVARTRFALGGRIRLAYQLARGARSASIFAKSRYRPRTRSTHAASVCSEISSTSDSNVKAKNESCEVRQCAYATAAEQQNWFCAGCRKRKYPSSYS